MTREKIPGRKRQCEAAPIGLWSHSPAGICRWEMVGWVRQAAGPVEVEMLNAGEALAAVLQGLEISEATHHCWRSQYGGMTSEQANRLKWLSLVDEYTRECLALKGGAWDCLRGWPGTQSYVASAKSADRDWVS